MTWLSILAASVLGALLLWLYGVLKAVRGEKRYPPEGEFVTVEGVRLHYVRKGSGPPVILLHGSDGFLQDFPAPLLGHLALEYDVIAFDRPGHGYSEAPEETLGPAVQARLLLFAWQKLGIEKPLLVGHSWSGSLLMNFAVAQPDEITGIVLLGAWLYGSEEPLPLLFKLPQLPVIGPLIVCTLLPLVKRLLIRITVGEAFSPDPIPSDYERAANALWQRWPWQTHLFVAENESDRPFLTALEPHYPAINLPVIIVTGDMDKVVPPERHSFRLHRDLPASELIVLPHTGHEVQQTRPAEVIEAINRCFTLSKSTGAEKTAKQRPKLPAPLERARELVLKYGWNSTAYQILHPDMEHWFSEDGDAVVGYVQRGRVFVVAGSPICAESRLLDVAEEFERYAAAKGYRVCFFAAGTRLRALLDQGTHSTVVMGAQPSWNPEHWSDILSKSSSLRAQLNRAKNKGVSVSEWTTKRAQSDSALRACLDEWLSTRSFPRLHFLTETVSLDHLQDRRIFVAEREGSPIGFLVASPVPDRNGWLVEQIVRGNSTPNGAVELMVDDAMRTFADESSEYVTLGLAPLSRRAHSEDVQRVAWLKLLMAWVRAHGRRFYNFEGLDAFKAKFKPDAWEPIYAISNEPRFSFGTLYAVAAAFSEGSPVWAVARALWMAVLQELNWLKVRLRIGRAG
jgi:phosphatidylglycerol lysyltransferase